MPMLSFLVRSQVAFVVTASRTNERTNKMWIMNKKGLATPTRHTTRAKKWATTPSQFKALQCKLKQLHKQINTNQHRRNNSLLFRRRTKSTNNINVSPCIRLKDLMLHRYHNVSAHYGINMNVIANDVWHFWCAYTARCLVAIDKVATCDGALTLPAKGEFSCTRPFSRCWIRKYGISSTFSWLLESSTHLTGCSRSVWPKKHS